MTSPKIIFFDAGGTLFRPYPSVGGVYAKVAARHGVTVDAELVEKIFHEKWHERNGITTLAGLTSEKIEREWWYALVGDVFGNLGAFKDFDAFFHELYDIFARVESWRLFDDTIPVLGVLKERGFRLGIISNWDHRLFSIVEQLGLARYFENVTASSVVGTAKPGKRIFDVALEAMGVPAAGCWHIGDSLEDDYHGASRAGLKAVLLDRAHPQILTGRPAPAQLRGRHHKAYNGVTRIETLLDLPALLS